MFKRKLRRFDPRFGVSEQMLDAERVYLRQELTDCLVLSVNELRKLLQDRQAKIVSVDGNLYATLRGLPDRERLAIRCMLARDFYHIGALYERLVRTPQVEEATGGASSFPEEQTDERRPLAVIPFAEWLFPT